jgi:hypothetical protein
MEEQVSTTSTPTTIYLPRKARVSANSAVVGFISASIRLLAK